MSGLRVLVAGGGLGMGQFITEYLVNKYNARVVVFGLHVSDSIAALEKAGKIHVVRGDATKAEATDQAMKAVQEHLGGLDSLVITMGVMGEIERFGKSDMDRMRSTFEIDVFVPMALTQQYLPLLRESKGKLVILSSLVDSEVTRIGWSSYSSAKAALTRFITILGLEEDEARVFGVYPGLTRTNMVDDLISGKFKGKMSDEDVAWFIDQDKQDLLEPPEWTANAVSKLVVGKVTSTHGETVMYSDLDLDYRDYDT